MDEMDLLGGIGSQSVLGIWIGIIINYLRSHGWLGIDARTKKNLTLATSYILTLATTIGVHWTVSGDFLTGGSLTISIPSAEHLLEGATLAASSLGGQKGWALMAKMSEALTALAKQPVDPSIEEKRKKLEAELAQLEQSNG